MKKIQTLFWWSNLLCSLFSRGSISKPCVSPHHLSSHNILWELINHLPEAEKQKRPNTVIEWPMLYFVRTSMLFSIMAVRFYIPAHRNAVSTCSHQLPYVLFSDWGGALSQNVHVIFCCDFALSLPSPLCSLAICAYSLKNYNSSPVPVLLCF